MTTGRTELLVGTPRDEGFRGREAWDFTVVDGRGLSVPSGLNACEVSTFDLSTGDPLVTLPIDAPCTNLITKSARTLFVRGDTVWIWMGFGDRDIAIGHWVPVDVRALGLQPQATPAMPASGHVALLGDLVALSRQGVTLWDLPQ